MREESNNVPELVLLHPVVDQLPALLLCLLLVEGVAVREDGRLLHDCLVGRSVGAGGLGRRVVGWLLVGGVEARGVVLVNSWPGVRNPIMSYGKEESSVLG